MERYLPLPLQEIIDKAYHNATQKGFYTKSTKLKEIISIICLGIGKFLKATKVNRYADLKSYNALCLVYPENERQYYDQFIKDTAEDKLSDTFIRIFSLMGFMNIPATDLQSVIEIEGTRLESDITPGSFCFEWMKCLINGYVDRGNRSHVMEINIARFIGLGFKFCEQKEFDIKYFIDLKMQYNQNGIPNI